MGSPLCRRNPFAACNAIEVLAGATRMRTDACADVCCTPPPPRSLEDYREILLRAGVSPGLFLRCFFLRPFCVFESTPPSPPPPALSFVVLCVSSSVARTELRPLTEARSQLGLKTTRLLWFRPHRYAALRVSGGGFCAGPWHVSPGRIVATF